jgi:hypothetical protein
MGLHHSIGWRHEVSCLPTHEYAADILHGATKSDIAPASN